MKEKTRPNGGFLTNRISVRLDQVQLAPYQTRETDQTSSEQAQRARLRNDDGGVNALDRRRTAIGQGALVGMDSDHRRRGNGFESSIERAGQLARDRVAARGTRAILNRGHWTREGTREDHAIRDAAS